ncbi:hypothetical protein A2U01_0032626, partial [Trifolium medium]|nr:hypothetical protein [Trifolium medium]
PLLIRCNPSPCSTTNRLGINQRARQSYPRRHQVPHAPPRAAPFFAPELHTTSPDPCVRAHDAISGNQLPPPAVA